MSLCNSFIKYSTFYSTRRFRSGVAKPLLYKSSLIMVNRDGFLLSTGSLISTSLPRYLVTFFITPIQPIRLPATMFMHFSNEIISFGKVCLMIVPWRAFFLLFVNFERMSTRVLSSILMCYSWAYLGRAPFFIRFSYIRCLPNYLDPLVSS